VGLILHTVADTHQKPAVRPRRRKRRGLFFLLLMLAVIVGVVVYPPAYLFALRQVLAVEAWRYGFNLSIGDMKGSVAEPVWLYKVKLTHDSPSGAATLLEIDSAHTEFAWKHLFWRRDRPFWSSLSLDGLNGIIEVHMTGERAKAAPSASSPFSPLHLPASVRPPPLVLPASLSITKGTVAIRQGANSVLMQDIDLAASEDSTGHLTIGALSVHEPWMVGLFSNCTGSLGLHESQLVLWDMKLADSVSIASASADLPALLHGRLQMQFELAAFSGKIQGELSSGEEHLQFDSDGTFSHISVKQLAAFFGQDADGSITEGKFTFHGSPHDLTKTTFTTYFRAGDFRWGARSWNSLVAGATYVDHQLRIPELELQQAHNTLSLKGEMGLPEDWKKWWKTDFNFNVNAKIDNLSDLSALLGPGFGDIFGQLTVDGLVSGENSSFNGQLIVSGSHLSFRKAPLDKLEAAIKVHGNEVELTNAEFTHGDDFLRAQGVVNILGEKRYWGEVKASVADLSLYSSFLQPPIAPAPLSGGLMLDWSGDGARNAHSGAFTVKLKNVRPLVAKSEVATWQPIDLTAEGSYSPGNIYLRDLVFGNGQTTVSSRVTANESSLTLQGLKLQHGKATWLSGDAQAPLNVWAAWLNRSAASWWNFDSPCKLDLKFDRLSIADALLLAGKQQPFEGEITGALKSDGTLAKLSANGHLAIKNGGATLPVGVLKTVNAGLDFSGSQATLPNASGELNGMAWKAAGTVAGPDVRAAVLGLGVKVAAAPIDFGPGISGTAAWDIVAAGEPEKLAISGTGTLEKIITTRSISAKEVLAPGGTGLQGAVPALSIAAPAGSNLDLQLNGEVPVKFENGFGLASPELSISGPASAPRISGKLNVSGSVTDGADELNISSGTFFINSIGQPPSLVLMCSGDVGGQVFEGYIYGNVMDKKFSWAPDRFSPLPDAPPIFAPAPIPSPFALP
jgi:hypothetical protein